MWSNSDDDLFARKDDIYSLLNLVYENSLLWAHCCVAPIRCPLLFLSYFLKGVVNISIVLWTDIKQIIALSKNMFTLTRLVLRNVKIFFLTTRRADAEFQEMIVAYENIKKILMYFHFLPLPNQENIVTHLVLKKFPDLLWDNIVPYPHAFFEGSIIDANAFEGKVIAVRSECKDNVKEIFGTSTRNQIEDVNSASSSNNETPAAQINNEAPDKGRKRSSISSHVKNENAGAADDSPIHWNKETAEGDQASTKNHINNEKRGEGDHKAGGNGQGTYLRMNEKPGEGDNKAGGNGQGTYLRTNEKPGEGNSKTGGNGQGFYLRRNEKPGESDGLHNSTSETEEAGDSNLGNFASFINNEKAQGTSNVDLAGKKIK